MRRAAALLAVLLGATAVGGCAGGSAGRGAADRATPGSEVPATSAVADHTLIVDVQRSRSAAARGVLEVRLRTTGDVPLEVTRLQLLDERFASVPPAPKSTPVRPGGEGIVTPIPAGDPVCDAATDGAPRVAVSLLSQGETIDVVVPVAAAGTQLLTALHTDECRRLGLVSAIDLAFGDDWTVVSPATAQGTIELRRTTATGTVVLDQVQGTVIFSLRLLDHAADGPVLTLPPDADATEVAVEVSAARCDPHALIESKKTYLFPMWVRLDDAPAIFLTVEPTGPARAAFETLLQEGCHPPDRGDA